MRPAHLRMDRPFVVSFGNGNNLAVYALTWIDCPAPKRATLAVGSDDGVVVWLNDQRIHTQWVSRGHRSKQDKIPIRLRAGRNKLLMKVTQSSAGWAFSAHLLDEKGNELPGVRYMLSPEGEDSEAPAKPWRIGITGKAEAPAVTPEPIALEPLEPVTVEPPEPVLEPVAPREAIVEKQMIASEALGRESPVFFVLPGDYASSRKRYPVVYFLHAWTGKAGAGAIMKEMANRHDVIIVCPDGGRDSWYVDSPMTPGYNYETHLVTEVVAYANAHYRTLASREGRAMLGRSMGGHGAMLLALRQKNVFGAVGSIHGCLDIRPFHDKWEWESINGLDPLRSSPNATKP